MNIICQGLSGFEAKTASTRVRLRALPCLKLVEFPSSLQNRINKLSKKLTGYGLFLTEKLWKLTFVTDRDSFLVCGLISHNDNKVN